MAKVSLGAQTIMYPHPAVLVGAAVDGKPTFRLTLGAVSLTADRRCSPSLFNISAIP